MALPTIILNNQTVSDIDLVQLTVTVPGSGSVTISDFDRTDEILNDPQLQSELGAGNLTVTYDGVVLTIAQSQAKILPQQALDILHNLTAIVDPTVTDDDAAGYSVGSLWQNVSTTNEFRCFDDAVGAAVWLEITAFLNPVILITPTTRHGFSTITAGLAAAVSGDIVQVSPGTYAESVTVPAGVTLQGFAGVDGGASITGAAATGTRVTLSDGSAIDDFSVTLPTDAVGAITFAGGAATEASISEITLTGSGANGVGISNTGAGELLIHEVTYRDGTCDQVILATAGEIFIDNLFIDTGTVAFGVEVTGAGTAATIDNYRVRAGASVSHGCHFEDAVEIRGVGFILIDTTIAIHIATDGPLVELISCILIGGTWDLLVEPGVTTATLDFIACEMTSERISYPAGFLETASATLSYQSDTVGDEGFHIIGELSVGAAEHGNETALGEGDSYTRGMVVLNYTSATAGTDGTFNADVSVAASSLSGSTFGFPSGAVGDAIVWGSSLADSSDTLKHWGLAMLQTTAMSTDGVVIWEIWDGAAWAEIAVLDVQSAEFYRYANNVFIRANSDEQIRYGIDEFTTWASKTLNSSDLFWSRVRITSSPTTNPLFQQSKLHSSHFEAHDDGTLSLFGIARFRDTLTVAGNAFGESGGVTAVSVAVGSGGVPTGWTQQNKNSLLNGSADAIMTQYTLPRGIDTSQQIFLEYAYNSSASSANTNMIASILPLEVSGVLVADPAGGITPTARTNANTETLTAKVAQTDTINGIETAVNKLHKISFGPFDVSDYYEGDIMLVRIELDDDGAGSTNIGTFTLELDGVKWTFGDKI